MNDINAISANLNPNIVEQCYLQYSYTDIGTNQNSTEFNVTLEILKSIHDTVFNQFRHCYSQLSNDNNNNISLHNCIINVINEFN
ncbi:hypothetical protein GJ496_005886, partial [Pomphorhynchus laevis]